MAGLKYAAQPSQSRVPCRTLSLLPYLRSLVCAERNKVGGHNVHPPYRTGCGYATGGGEQDAYLFGRAVKSVSGVRRPYSRKGRNQGLDNTAQHS